MGRLKAGTTGVLGIGDAVPQASEPARAKVLARSVRWPQRGRHAVRYAAAQAANIPAHRPCATRGLRGCIVQRQPTARCPLAHTAVSKRYTSPGVLRSKPKKHRARDAVETADLRFYPTSTQVRFAAGPPRRREVLRSVGPSPPRRPAPPRNLFERTEGKKGRSPAPEKQSHRAA